MEPGAVSFLIVCPLVFLASFVDAIAGGGGLISLPAYLLAGVPIHNAIATNKLSSASGTVIPQPATVKTDMRIYRWRYRLFWQRFWAPLWEQIWR